MNKDFKYYSLKYLKSNGVVLLCELLVVFLLGLVCTLLLGGQPLWLAPVLSVVAYILAELRFMMAYVGKNVNHDRAEAYAPVAPKQDKIPVPVKPMAQEVADEDDDDTLAPVSTEIADEEDEADAAFSFDTAEADGEAYEPAEGDGADEDTIEPDEFEEDEDEASPFDTDTPNRIIGL